MTIKKCCLVFGIIVTIFSLNACNSAKTLNTQTQQHTCAHSGFIELNGMKVSVNTKFVINDINAELKEQNQKLNGYTPSEKLVNKHHLQLQNEQYYVTGTIKFDVDFKLELLNKNGMETGQLTKRFVTVRIPVSKLNDFFKTEGIEYFETSNKVTIK